MHRARSKGEAAVTVVEQQLALAARSPLEHASVEDRPNQMGLQVELGGEGVCVGGGEH